MKTKNKQFLKYNSYRTLPINSVIILFMHQNSKVDERIRVLSKKEIVTSSAAVDLNASLDPVHVVVKIDNDSDEESLR